MGDEKLIAKFTDQFPPITDDNPKSEYFLIRQKLNVLPMMSGAELLDIIEE